MLSLHPEDLLDDLTCYHYALAAVARFAIDDMDTIVARNTIDLLHQQLFHVSQKLAVSIAALSTSAQAETPFSINSQIHKQRKIRRTKK